MRRVGASLCVVALLMTRAVSAAGAGQNGQGQAQRLTISSTMTINAPYPNTGTFSATGPAVTSRLVCPSGTVTDVYIKFDQTNLVVIKAFVCGDGGNTFILKLQVRQDAQTESFTWVVQGGTGPSRTLRGSGTDTTDAGDLGEVVTTYTGSVSGQNSQ